MAVFGKKMIVYSVATITALLLLIISFNHDSGIPDGTADAGRAFGFICLFVIIGALIWERYRLTQHLREEKNEEYLEDVFFFERDDGSIGSSLYKGPGDL